MSYFRNKFEGPMHNYQHISIAIDLTTPKNKISLILITKLSRLQPKKNLTPLYISAAGSFFADNADSRVLCHQMLVCKLLITIV